MAEASDNEGAVVKTGGAGSPKGGRQCLLADREAMNGTKLAGGTL